MPTYISKQSGLWSSASTWLTAAAGTFAPTADAGVPPQSGARDKIIIRGANTVVIYDVNGEFGDGTATQSNTYTEAGVLANAIVLSGGKLQASRTTSTSLTSYGSIALNRSTMPWFDWGTTTDPVSAVTAELVFGSASLSAAGDSVKYGLYGWNSQVSDYTGAGLLESHSITIVGKTKTRNTRLDRFHSTGTSQLSVLDCTGWEVGDRITVEIPHLFAPFITNTIGNITNISGNVVTINTTLNANCPSGVYVGNFSSNITIRPGVVAVGGVVTNNCNSHGIQFNTNGNNSLYEFKNFSMVNFQGGTALNIGAVYARRNVVIDGISIHNVLGNNTGTGIGFSGGVGYEHVIKNYAHYHPNGNGFGYGFGVAATVYCYDSVSYRAGYTGSLDRYYYVYMNNVRGWATSSNFGSQVWGLNLNFENCNFRCGFTGNNNPVIFNASFYNIKNLISNSYLQVCSSGNGGNSLASVSEGSAGTYETRNCTLSSVFASVAGLPTAKDFVGNFYSVNGNVLDNRRVNSWYSLSGNYSMRNRGVASYELVPLKLNLPFFFYEKIPSKAGIPQRFVGYLRYQSSYGNTNLPYIKFTDDANVTTVTQIFSCAPIPDVWQKFDLTVTPVSDGNLTMTVNAQMSSASTRIYLDGLSFDPINPRSRHYGFSFNDTLPNRTINTLTTLTENQVSAISTVNNLDHLYDSSNYWSVTNPSLTSYIDLYTQNGKILDFGSRNITLSSASTGFTYLSGSNTIILNTASLSAGNNFNTINTTGTITLASQTLSNITINANVNQTTPSNLTNVTINGILSYNTNNPYAITYTNTSVLTARNLGSDTVTIQQINSTITDPKAPQIQTYAATYLNLTLQGGYIAIYDNNGVQQYYTNSDQVIALPASSVGTWTYKIGRYGYKMVSGSFTINPSVGGTIAIAPTYVQDIYVNDISSNVVNYTDFTSTQNIYDYLSYYRTTSVGLSYGELNSYIASLDIGSYRLILSDTVSPVFNFDGSKFIVKSSSIQGKAITTTGGIVLSGNNTFSNITLNANVSSNAVSNLNTVNVNGILTYNTNTPYNLTYTNTSVLTARNDGTATINIKRVNSTITDATDAEIENYAPTYIDLTLLGGYIAIYDNNNVQQYYRNTDGTIELPYSATGNWSYSVGRYGYKLVTGTFAVNRSTGGTVTIVPVYEQDIYVVGTLANVSAYNTFSKTQNIYDYLSYYRTTSAGLGYGDLNLYSSTLDIGSNNIILFDSASPAFSYDGSTFVLNSVNLSGAAIVTTGNITLSGNSSISDITLTTNVVDQTPADLTNVKINGILAYNTNSSASITYTNTTVGTVVNDGAATVLIKRVNSSINNATDPQIDDYAPTIINVTPNGGSVAIYNDSNVRQYFITTNSSVLLPYNATGTWSYKVTKYGYNLIDQPFTVDPNTGATINIVPNYITDNFITDTLNNVENYTDLNTANEIHDYLMYFQTLSTGIDYGDLEYEAFGSLTFSSGVALSANASQMASVSGSTLILKSTYLTDSIILVSPGDITSYAGNTISDGIKLRTATYDSEIYMNQVDSITFYPSEANRDSNVNGNIVLTSPTIYRFKYGSTVNGINFSNFIYAKITTGGSSLLIKSAIVAGTNEIDFGVTGNITTMLNNLKVINSGVQKASKLIPHTTNI